MRVCLADETKTAVYQWDVNQSIKITGVPARYVDYLIGSEVKRVEIVDGVCRVPDEALETAGRLGLWVRTYDDTRYMCYLDVIEAPQPPTRSVTPTQYITIEQLTDEAREAAEEAIRAAELAQQVAVNNGFAVFTMSDDGEVMLTRTSNIADRLNFELTDDGELEVIIYG